MNRQPRSIHQPRSARTGRGVPALAAGALLALALTGCSSAVDAAKSSGPDQGPVSGGTLTLVTSADHQPATFYQGLDSQNTINGLVYESLIDYPEDSLEAQPRLATTWEISEDGKTVTVDLRDDVTFHSGRAFTSRDVEFSYRTYTEPARAGQLARTAGLITKFDTSDEHRVVFTLSAPASNFLDLLDIVPIIDSESIDSFSDGSSYNGTGPYRFEKWTPNSKITFTANEDYWGGRPNLDAVELTVVPDSQTQTAQLRSGQADLLLYPNSRDLTSLATDDKFQVINLTGVERNNYVGMNVKAPGLTDVRVRRAIAQAIDRKRILDEVFLGHGDTDNLPWPDYSPAYDAELNDTWTGDLAAAKKELDGVTDVPTIPISYTAGGAQSEQIALIIADNLAKIGLKTKVEPLDMAASNKALLEGSYGGIWISQHSFGQYTPSTLVTSAFPFNSLKNASNFIDTTYQADAQKAWAQSDPTSAAAKASYDALNRDLLENAFVVDVTNYELQWAATSDLHDVKWSKRGEIDLSDAYLSE